MRKGIRITLITGGCLMVLGLVIGIIGASMNDFRFDVIQSTEYVRQESAFDQKLEEIHIRTITDDINVKKSEDGKTRVTYYNSKDERMVYDLDVIKNKDAQILRIEQKDERKWYEHFFVFNAEQEEAITIYLPEESYRSFSLQSTSGEVDCQTKLQITGDMKAFSISGDIRLTDNSCGGTVDVNCTSGDIQIDRMQSKVLNASSVSGNITLSSVHTQENVSLKTVSGDVQLNTVDSSRIDAKSTSGSIQGTLKSKGVYHCHTISGNITVPDNDRESGREYTFETVSGDIHISQ